MRALKILIIRVGAMGDVLHALPGVAALRRARPDWRIDWVVDPRWAPLLVARDGKGPIVNRVHLADTKLWSSAPRSKATLLSIRELGRALHREHYDVVVDMQGTLRSAVIGRMARASEFAGFRDPKEALAARLYRQRLQREGDHVVLQGATLLSEACGVPLTPAEVELPEDPAEAKWAGEQITGKPLCLLAPTAGWGAKQWPVHCYAELARELGMVGFDVLVNSSGHDESIPNRVAEESAGSARVISPGIPGLVELVRRAALVIGGDSGPVHLAAALEVPAVALFGPTDPQRNGPWGPGPHRVLRHASSVTSYKHVEEADPGIGRIAVPTVLGAAGDALAGLTDEASQQPAF